MFILFDIGGTNTRIALSHDKLQFEAPVKFKTPRSYEEGLRTIIEVIEGLASGRVVRGIAGGIRGPLNQQKTGIVSEVILTDWVNKALTEDLSRHFQAPVFLENDTAIVGLGEVHFGAGKGHEIVAYHTISTGVGGARFVQGRLDVARVGFEPGHQILDFDRSYLEPGVMPTLENLVSGAALERAVGKKPIEISQADPVWDELARRMACGLRNTIVYWSPDVIVLGGSMMIGNPRIRLDDVRRYTEGMMSGFMPCPQIVDANLGDDGGLFGAMALLALQAVV